MDVDMEDSSGGVAGQRERVQVTPRTASGADEEELALSRDRVTA
jgi:hypothetical protein